MVKKSPGRLRVALYTRVSADRQSVDNQLRELHQVAERMSWETGSAGH